MLTIKDSKKRGCPWALFMMFGHCYWLWTHWTHWTHSILSVSIKNLKNRISWAHLKLVFADFSETSTKYRLKSCYISRTQLARGRDGGVMGGFLCPALF